MIHPPLSRPDNTRPHPDRKIPILVGVLFGTVLGVVLVAAYVLYQLNQVRDDLERVHSELAQTRQQLLDEIAKVHETSTASSQTNQSTVESLKVELEAARQQAHMAAGQAKAEFTKRAEALAAKLDKMKEEHAETAKAVTEAVAQVKTVKTEAEATKARVGEVSTEVGSVKTELNTTKSELENTIAELKSTKGDLGLQSGLIATNRKELAALKALGDRDIIDLTLRKEKTPRKIANLRIRLKAADPKKNRYTVDVIADDKLIEKKDKTVNEPVQFILFGSAQPYELVVNEVKKDMISGYLSAPKPQPRRN